MGRKSKYDTGKLINVVVAYDIAFPDIAKIKSSEVASWAATEYEDLGDIQAYHFNRNDACKAKIDEINAREKMHALGSSSLLTKPTGIDDFFDSDSITQRRILIKTKTLIGELQDAVSALTTKVRYLSEDNEVLKSALENCKEESTTATTHKKNLDKLSKQLSYILRVIDEATVKKLLEDAGITDKLKSVLKNKEFMKDVKAEVVDINDMIDTAKALDTPNNTITTILEDLINE